MNKEWKSLIKENMLLFVVFICVVLGFIGYHAYNGIKYLKNSKTNFDGGILIEAPNEIKNYEANEYKIITTTDQDLAEFYLHELVTMWNTDPGKLYDLMTDKAKNTYSSRDDCINTLNKMKNSNIMSSTVAYYKVNKAEVIIETNDHRQFKLITNGINDYKIAYLGFV